MDPQLLKLSEFSSALTDVLTSLNKKVNVLDSGGTRVLSLAEQVEEHDGAIKGIENTLHAQKEAFQEAINAHAMMGKAVMEATTTQCGDIQNELVELRATTKKELSALQGVLEVSLRDSILHLADFMQPSAPTEIPVITESTSSQEMMAIMLGRIEQLEKKTQSQDLAYQMLKDSVEADSKSHEVFDELTARIVQSERNCEKQNKKIHEFEKRITALAACQSKTLKLINVVSQKVNCLATISWEKTSSLDIKKQKAVSLNDIIEQEVPLEYIPERTQVAVEVFQDAVRESEKESSPEEGLAKLMRATKPDGPLVSKRKSTLKDHAIAKAKSLAESKEAEKSGEQMYPTLFDNTKRSNPQTIKEEKETEYPFDDNVSLYSLDSSVMVEEYVMEKLEYLEQKVNDLMSSKDLNSGNAVTKRNPSTDTSPDTDFQMEELPNTNLTNELSSTSYVVSSNPAILKENAFRLLLRDTKAAWDLAFAELDKKVTKMNLVIEQMGTEPDDLHRRLSAFKTKVTHALEVISVALPESREEIITTIYDVMEDVRQDAKQVVILEEEIRTIIENKDPGTALSVSQIPTYLPELLQEACNKTTEVLGERIQKYDLSVRIDELAALIRGKVDIPNFIALEEDFRIALTLKADQKYIESVLDKKSSIADAEKFREYVTDEIDAMRAMLATSSQRNQGFQSGTTSAEFEVMASGLTQRMDKLYKNMQETASKMNGFVPRQEIETALQALLNEVKAVRGVCVEKNMLEERLQHKADNNEVEKLLAILQGTVGDPMSTQYAAIQKCLVCDKPVNPFHQATNNRPNSPTTYFDKPSASGSPSKQRPQTSSGVPRPQSHPERLRQTAEMNILRNSMESLPALDDSRLNSSSMGRPDSRSNNMSAHSRRIRSAAGGGLGPSYRQDSR